MSEKYFTTNGYLQIHSFVHVALITADPVYAVYFRRDDSIDQYLVIVGIKSNPTVNPNKASYIKHRFILVKSDN